MQAIHLLLLLAVLSQYARAQLVGCEAVHCPAGGCIVGSTTNLDLGITNFTSGLSPEYDLTWTVGISDTPHHNAINDTWMRSYYLGTPPSLDLEKESSIGGCALFFEDSGTYQFNHSAPKTSIGTCQDAWSAECVNDLLARAANITATLSSNAATTLNQSTFCSKLGPALKADLPISCTATLGLDKIPIVLKDLSGPGSSLQPVQQTNCTLTTGGLGYKVGLVETESYHHDFAESYTSAFIFGVTPILTVFYPTKNGNSSTILQQPEFHLSCVKIIEPDATDANGPTLLNAASRSAASVYNFVSLSAASVLIFSGALTSLWRRYTTYL